MRTKVVKWGNSHGIRLPVAYMRHIQIAENDPVEIVLEDETIVIKKISSVGHRTTAQRLAEFYGEDFEQNAPAPKEVDWGEPVGNEIW